MRSCSPTGRSLSSDSWWRPKESNQTRVLWEIDKGDTPFAGDLQVRQGTVVDRLLPRRRKIATEADLGHRFRPGRVGGRKIERDGLVVERLVRRVIVQGGAGTRLMLDTGDRFRGLADDVAAPVDHLDQLTPSLAFPPVFFHGVVVRAAALMAEDQFGAAERRGDQLLQADCARGPTAGEFRHELGVVGDVVADLLLASAENLQRPPVVQRFLRTARGEQRVESVPLGRQDEYRVDILAG